MNSWTALDVSIVRTFEVLLQTLRETVVELL
jgi:hypothetical protein